MFRPDDIGELSYYQSRIEEGKTIGTLPQLILTEEQIKQGWKLDGFYLATYTSEGVDYELISTSELVNKVVNDDIIVQVRMIKDIIEQGEGNDVNVPDNIDDRLQAVVNFKDYDGSLLKAQVVLKGDSATAPQNPEREHYIFAGWNTDYSNIQENLTVTALYNEKTHTLRYVLRTGDKGILSDTEYTIEETNFVGVERVPTVKLEKGWKFVGYYIHGNKISGLDISTMILTEDLNIEIRTMPDIIGQGENNDIDRPDDVDDRLQAIVRFYDENILMKAQVVLKGTSAVAPAKPVHEDKTFKSWDKEFKNIQSDMDIFALYNNVFTVNFAIRNGDAGKLSSTSINIEEGKMIDRNIPSITMSSEELKTEWKFVGYYIAGVRYTNSQLASYQVTKNLNIEIRTMPDIEGKGNNTTTPDGIDDRLQAVVNFINYDDSLIKAQVVLKGESAKAPENPTREGYLFAGWDRSFANITKDTTVKAIFNKKEEQKQNSKDDESYVNPGCGIHSYWSEKDKMCKCEPSFDTPQAGIGCSGVKVPNMAQY